MPEMITLDAFLEAHSSRSDLNSLILHIAKVCVTISEYTTRGQLAGSLGEVIGKDNIQGEPQKKMDVIADQLFIDALQPSGLVAALASEEIDELIHAPETNRGKLLLAYDPLDGSSNIDTNIPVGSIFSILNAPAPQRQAKAEDFFQKGSAQLAAGYALYGQCTMLVISIGKGTHGFTLDPQSGKFILTQPTYTVPEQTGEYAINTSNQRFWHTPMAEYFEQCQAGKDGLRGKDYNMRWVGSMVADANRILVRGGVYVYPQNTKQPLKAGRLRLLYETNPIGLLIEQAGGRASTCTIPMLEVVPSSLHQRISVAFGSREEVEHIEQLFQNASTLP